MVFFGVTSATAQLLGDGRQGWLQRQPGWSPRSAPIRDVIGGAGSASKRVLNGVYTPSWIAPIQDTKNPYVRQMKVIADRADLPWNFYTYYGINTAYVLAQALDAAGPNLTREGLVNALQTESRSFRSAAVVPFRITSVPPGSDRLLHGPYNSDSRGGADDELHHDCDEFVVRQGEEGDLPSAEPDPEAAAVTAERKRGST